MFRGKETFRATCQEHGYTEHILNGPTMLCVPCELEAENKALREALKEVRPDGCMCHYSYGLCNFCVINKSLKESGV